MRVKLFCVIFLVLSISLIGLAKVSVKIGPSVAMFNSGDDNLKEIYGGNNFIYGFKTGASIWNGFSGWLTGYFYSTDAKVSYTKEAITFNSSTIGLSLRYTPPIKWSIKPYLSVGYINVSYKEQGNDETVNDVNGSTSGYSLMFGFDFRIDHRFSFEFETKYDSAIASPTGFNVELGGFSIVASFLIKVL